MSSTTIPGGFHKEKRPSCMEDMGDQAASEQDEEEAAVPRQDRVSGRKIPFLTNRGSRKRRGANFAQEYPPDELGAQMGPNARIWRVYLDEADEYDTEMMESFRDTTDVLLVFAGLFSAVVSTFVSQVSQTLQPDYAQVTASLMTEMVLLQRAIAAGTPVANIPPSQLSFSNADTTTASSDHWVNGLWFTSLSLSLVSALLAVLVKQWLQHYNSALSGTPRERVLVRHFRFMGLQTWKVSEIIQTLPVLLHVALFMFMAGLVVLVWTLDLAIASMILLITVICVLCYSVSHILPSFYPSCSYKTPISNTLPYIRSLLCLAATLRLIQHNRNLGYSFNERVFRFFGLKFSFRWIPVQSGKQAELYASESEIDSVLFSALAWLYSASSDPLASAVAAQSVVGLPFHIDQKYASIMNGPVWRELFSSDPQSLGPDFGVTLLACCATQGQVWLDEDYYDAYIALRPNAPPIIQSLSAFIWSYSVPSEGIAANIVSDQLSLPPWMWKSLFEYGSWTYNSDPLKLLLMLLNVLKSADLTMHIDISAKANWNLPSTIGLVELCKLDERMAITILGFASRHLLSGHSAEAVHNQLNARFREGSNSFALAIIYFIHGILDHIEARSEVVGPNSDYLTAAESSLLSDSTDHWLEPAFMDALYRCIVLKNKNRHSNHATSIPLHHREPVATSTTLLLLYILDMLQHPWPSYRVPDIGDTSQFEELCYQVFSRQEKSVFDVFINNNGLATFRRCYPFRFTSKGSLRHPRGIFTPYVEFVTKLDKDNQRQHLDFISQRDNLAWFIWLSLALALWPLETSNDTPRDSLPKLLLALPIERQAWFDAVKVLLEELRKDSALFGPTDLIYSKVREGLEALGLTGDELRLYGYVTPALGYPAYFRRVIDSRDEDSAEPRYGPYAVYYSPETTSPATPPQLTQARFWGQRIEANDLERGARP